MMIWISSFARCMRTAFGLFLLLVSHVHAQEFTWEQLPDLPDALGVAGPFAGVSNDALIVAGGANFPTPVWENDKVWHDKIYVLTKNNQQYKWHQGGSLLRRTGYGAAVSTKDFGVICIGGNDGENTFASAYSLMWDSGTKTVRRLDLPDLPGPCAYGQAAIIDAAVYLVGGQSRNELSTAMNHNWKLDLSKFGKKNFRWEVLPSCPGPSRAFNITVAQGNGNEECLYVIGGRGMNGENVHFLSDVWEYSPRTKIWRERTPSPNPIMAGTAVGFGDRRIAVLGGADGSLFTKADELKDQHPGFPKTIWVYDTVNDEWSNFGEMPQNHVTTIPVRWGADVIIPSGEIRPRVRSPKIWNVNLSNLSK